MANDKPAKDAEIAQLRGDLDRERALKRQAIDIDNLAIATLRGELDDARERIAHLEASIGHTRTLLGDKVRELADATDRANDREQLWLATRATVAERDRELSGLRELADGVRWWLHWPQAKRDAIRDLSATVHDTIEALACWDSSQPAPGDEDHQ